MKPITTVPRFPARPTSGHKGTFGTVTLLAGSEGMLGAAILAARGALRGGSGLCRACLPADLMVPFTIAVPAATTIRRTLALDGFFDRSTAAVVGPGLGRARATGDLVWLVLRNHAGPVVLDADGLYHVAPLDRPIVSSGPVVLTPHAGEAARLLGSDGVNADRIAVVQTLAERSGHVAVLKGEATLVADGTRVFRNGTGNSGLATGGSGDVLAGLIGALLGQGMDPFDAACLGVNVHGKAGDLVASRLSKAGLCAEDLPLAIAEVMA